MGSSTTPQPLLTVKQLCSYYNVSSSWVYKRTKKGAIDPLPVVPVGSGLRFDSEKIRLYFAARQRAREGAILSTSDGNAQVNGKGNRSLTRRRFQTGYVRLREDRNPAWWEGFYREDIVTDSGEVVRKRRTVNLGLLSDVPTKRAAQRKLGTILAEINDADYRPRSTTTFRGFVQKYRELKMPTKKGTTQHGYENNLRVHFLPFFGDLQLAEINTETVQAFLNHKASEGKAFNTLKNLKWGLSSVFAAAIKYGYIKSNPVQAADLPPEEVREEQILPKSVELDRLIAALPEPLSTAVWLCAVTCVRPEELAFKWSDLKVDTKQLWIVRAVNRGKFHTPKYHRGNRPIQLTEADVERLLALKRLKKAGNDDWMFPNSRNTAPIRHEDILGRKIQPVADKLGLPHITWRLLRHWGATHMLAQKVPLKAAQERLGHSRPDLILRRYAHLLQESADVAASTLSLMVGGKSAALDRAMQSCLPEVGSQTAATAFDSALQVVEGVGGAGQNRTGE